MTNTPPHPHHPHPHQQENTAEPFATSPFTGKPDCTGDALDGAGNADGADQIDNPASSEPPANPGASA